MLASWSRLIQRYLVPSPVASAWHSLRHRCWVSPSARVQLSGRISFGRGTVVKPFSVIQTHTGCIKIGRNCAISSFDHISTGDGDVVLGDHVRLAPNVTIVGGTKAHERRDVLIVEQPPTETKGVSIGDDVLVGAGAVILPGCRIETGAVIGAGSVVTGDVPGYAIVAGAPARVVGQRE